MLPVAWSIYDSPFSWLCLSGLTYKHITPFHLSRDKKISCRTENNNCHVGGLQEYCDQTYMNSCKNKGFLHQEICNKQPYPSSFSIKEAWIFLTLVRCFFGARVHYLLGLMAFQIKLLFLGDSDCKVSACNTEDLGSVPGSERSLGEGYAYPLQYSCLENSMDKEAWQPTVHGISKSRTQLSD